MILTSEKAREVGGRMREVLQKRGFVKGAEHMLQEVWGHDDARQVVLTLTEQQLNDPVEAEVFDPRFRPDIAVAYNSKGLVVLLDREMNDAEATNEEGHAEEVEGESGARDADREADGAAPEGSTGRVEGAGGESG